MLGFLRQRRQRATPAPLLISTDIHCHIIPGVDDGSPDVATSLELVERMASWGIRRIIASPHVTADTFENTPATLDAPMRRLSAAIADKGIDIGLSRSAEYRLDNFFLKQLKEGLVTPLPGNHLLVENSWDCEPWHLDNLLFDIKLQGFRPILAHPERYIYYLKYTPHRYGELHRAGTYLQINLLSLAGYYGKDEQKMAESLIERGYADFLGTDLHHHRHADAIEAYLASKRYARIAGKYRPLNDAVFPAHSPDEES